MAKLVIHQPDGTLREVKLDCDRITIGRRADHDICLPYPAVSADQTKRTSRLDAGGVQKLPATGSLASLWSARSTITTR